MKKLIGSMISLLLIVGVGCEEAPEEIALEVRAVPNASQAPKQAPVKVELTSNVADAVIYYTEDGESPTRQSTQYTGPILISETTTLKFFAIAVIDGAEQETTKLAELYSLTNSRSRPASSPAGPPVIASTAESEEEDSEELPEIIEEATVAANSTTEEAPTEVVTEQTEPENQAPVFTNLTTLNAEENAAISYGLTIDDEDPTGVSFTCSNCTTQGADLSFDGTFTWTPDYSQAGSYNFNIVASDGEKATSGVLSVDVTHVNQAPVLASLGTQSGPENSIISFTASATDGDADTVTYSCSGCDESGMTFSDTTGAFSWTPGYSSSGNYSLTITASDGTSTDTETLALSITDTNRLPTATCTNTTQSHEPGDTITAAACTISDPDTSDTLTNTVSDCGLSISSGGSVTGTMPPYSCTAVAGASDGTDVGGDDLDFTVDYTNLGFKTVPHGLSGYNAIPDGSYQATFIDSANSNLWIATQAGLTKANLALDSFTNYTTADGLNFNEVDYLWASGNLVLVASDIKGYAFTTDGGSNWTANRNGRFMGAYGLDDGDGSHTLVLGYYDDYRVRVSSDNGANWSILGAASQNQATAFYAGDHDGDNSTTDQAYILAYTNEDVVYSLDSGSTWTTKSTSDHGVSDWIYGLAIVEYSSNVHILIGTRYGIRLSKDGGSSWSSVTTSSGLNDDNISGLIVDGTKIYAQHGLYNDGLSVSSDGGETWTSQFSSGRTEVGHVDGTYMTRTYNNYLYLSSDSGSTFSVSSNADDAPGMDTDRIYGAGDNVYTGGYYGENFWVSNDKGVTWSKKRTTDGLGHTTVSDIHAAGSRVFVAHGTYYKEGISVSTNSGSSFTNIDQTDGLPSDNVSDIWGEGDYIYVGTPSGLGVSTNFGTNWTHYTSDNGLPSNTVQDVYGIGNQHIFAATDAGLAISNNGGSTWTTRTTDDGLASNDIRDVFAFLQGDGSIKIYVRNSSKVDISTDGGATWSSTSMSLSSVEHMFVRGKTIFLTGNQTTRYSNDDGSTSTSIYNDTALSMGFGGYSSRSQVWISNEYIFSTSGAGLARSYFP